MTLQCVRQSVNNQSTGPVINNKVREIYKDVLIHTKVILKWNSIQNNINNDVQIDLLLHWV